jgi:hypothetical protein
MRNPYLVALASLSVVLGALACILLLIGTVPQNIGESLAGAVCLNLFWWSLLATLVLGGVIWTPSAMTMATARTRRALGDERPQWMIDGREGPDDYRTPSGVN